MNDEAPLDERIGSDIGDYRIEGVLGGGAMGQVFRATGPDGTVVAIKLIKAEHAGDPTFLKRFQREARIAQTVRHPHLVDVIESGESGGSPYMVQRFVTGQSLEAEIRSVGPLDIPTAMRHCSQIAAGLEALWEAGMIHRDIKPANILVDNAGDAHITDFGLAKDTQGTALTLPNQALGSIDYISPEQVTGGEVTGASDIYALGCVMFECLTGRPPFGHVQGIRALWAHLEHQPPDPASLRHDLPPTLARALLTALAKDPAERPSTAGEYARLLAQAAE